MSEAPDAISAEARVQDATRHYWRAILVLLSLLVFLNLSVLGWFVQRELERQHRLDTNTKILSVVARSGVQLDCFVDVYFTHPVAGTDDVRRQALVTCVNDKLKGLPR